MQRAYRSLPEILLIAFIFRLLSWNSVPTEWKNPPAVAAICKSAGGRGSMTRPPGGMTETPDPGRKAGMDALSDVLRVTHLTGGVFLHAEFFAPWCIAARVAPEHCAPALGPASHLIIYHYVVEGDFRIRVEGESGEDLVIEAGEVVLLPRNDLHLIGSDLSLPPVAGSDIIQPPKDGGLFSIRHGGAGGGPRVLCGVPWGGRAPGRPADSPFLPL